MSQSNKRVENPLDEGQLEETDSNIAVSTSTYASVGGSVKHDKTQQRKSSSSDRQIKFERAQKCLENAALVSKRIKEHRKATAELLGRPFDDDAGDTVSEVASTMSERTSYSAVTDTSTTLSVQDALNIPGISESLANTLKQKELLMERIKQYKEISKRPIVKSPITPRESISSIRERTAKSTANADILELQDKLKEKDDACSIMQIKMATMETTVMDLQEKISEKDQIIEAKTKATSLMSDNLSKKEKDSLSLLEDTRQQMTKMQENFIAMEAEWKEEKFKLIKDIEKKDEKISSLEQANTILENARFEISVAHSKLSEELELKSKEISELQEKLNNLSEVKYTPETVPEKVVSADEEKGSIEIAKMEELTRKIELLEQLNCQIRQTNKVLENKVASSNMETKPSGSPVKKGSPLPSRKGGRNTVKSKSPWSNLSSESLPQETDKKQAKNEITKLEMVIQSLNKEILEKEYALSQKDEILKELEKSVSDRDITINELSLIKQAQEMTPVEKIDVAIETVGIDEPMSLIVTETDEPDISDLSEFENPINTIKDLKAQIKKLKEQVAALNEEIDISNKNMIKVKSNHKLKIKQMQKTIDNLSKVSDSNAEIIRLNEELHQLSQKVAELEEEKGNLQLHLVDYDSGRMTESDTYKKLVEIENLAETRLKVISALEAQKFDLVQELHELQQKNIEMEDKLEDMSQLQSEQVCSEIKSVQLEEVVDKLTASIKELELVIDNLKLDKEQLNNSIKILKDEKEELSNKLDHYIQENIELTDKLEKLSAEKVSSAESIEIVESLTTQEKLELEEYNKEMSDNKLQGQDMTDYKEISSRDKNEIEKLVQESAELNSKIELFTQERQEVMEKLNKLSIENESLQDNIFKLNMETGALQKHIDALANEKKELQALNTDLNKQIEVLNRERVDIMKESTESTKTLVDESVETSQDLQHDDKMSGEKGSKGAKSVKQLTKEILKLKNTIKEREAEIGDCQMKILSLEEQQQKQVESLQALASYEAKIKSLTDENLSIREELDFARKQPEPNNDSKLNELNNLLQQDIFNLKQEYASVVNTRDNRIKELEGLLIEYEKQIKIYNNTLQEKDKDLTEYINQITKLNEVSKKLKSTIEVLEEEKAKDQNAEVVKSLNKQITVYQKKVAEYEDRIKVLEDEKNQLLSLKAVLENKNKNLELELQKLHESLAEKQLIISSLQAQQQKHTEEMNTVLQESKQRDEEIHEIKLQLRKESIENEKLRTALEDKSKAIEPQPEELNQIKCLKDSLEKVSKENSGFKDQQEALEIKNKELMEKLKKFAANLKKKAAMYTDIENQLIETQKLLEVKNLEVEHLSSQHSMLPQLQDKLKTAEGELNKILAEKTHFEQLSSNELSRWQYENKSLQEQLLGAENKISSLNDTCSQMNDKLHNYKEHINVLQTQIDALKNKLAEYEIEQKNHLNLITKINTLENDATNKELEIKELLEKIEKQERLFEQHKHAYEAKSQERELYIENLETEISKYKSRICRLEESVSVMENRRHSIECKANQLDDQLLEKQKSYSEYSTQEDELVNRLAILMDHDRVLEKELRKMESENHELQYKIQTINEESEILKKSLSEAKDQCNLFKQQISKTSNAENDAIINYQRQVKDLEAEMKKMKQDHHIIENKNKEYIAVLESEFSAQIESAIKEKKLLSEKYEKVNEHITQLEHKLHDYKSNIANLTLSLEEATRLNEELKQSANGKTETPDYTEQYISEINRLNAVVNAINQELQNNTSSWNTFKLSYENKISELNNQLQVGSEQMLVLVNENNYLKQSYDQLLTALKEKEDHINQLMERKKVTFEMSIPKTEGMIISSTIEPVNEDKRNPDISSLESQIVTNIESSEAEANIKTGDKKQENISVVEEPIIVPKKTYLCYKGEETSNIADSDPFNSDEGWGLEYTDTATEVVPGFSHFNEKILKLQNDNETLKSEITASNAKLLKSLKKIKELKSTNEMLLNELKLSKQMSQSSLDSAIEDELKNNVQELEKKIADMNTEINKEKREKEALKKQNEVFNSANDRLTEMKEKLDNEIELWKFKFKEVNDKMGKLQWESDKTPEHKSTVSPGANDSKHKEDILKLENENDELQIAVDQAMAEIKDLKTIQTRIKQENDALTLELQKKSSSLDLEIKNQISMLQKENDDLKVESHTNELKLIETEKQYQLLVQNHKELLKEHESLQKSFEINQNELSYQCKSLENEVISLKLKIKEADDQILSLVTKIENFKSNEVLLEQHGETKESDSLIFAEKCSALEDELQQTKAKLSEDDNNILELKNINLTMERRISEYEDQVKELNDKMQKINSENNELLSTVTELRSSISNAMDQRGFEIAELWKQHLAQREAEFLKAEQELRAQLSAAENKYEQLLDNFQSTNQEETCKVVMTEQISSLQNKLQDKEEHLNSLQSKYAEVINQIDILRSEIEDEKIIFENKLLNQQEDYEKQMKDLTDNHEHSIKKYETIIKEVQDEVNEKTAVTIQLSKDFEEAKVLTQNAEATIIDLSNQLRMKDTEVYQKTNELTIALAQRNEELDSLRKEILQYEKKVEDLTYDKESELAVLRLKMHENKEYYEGVLREHETEKNDLIEELQTKIKECTKLNRQITDMNKQLEEHAMKASETQAVLENQELEIVTLKDEIEELQHTLKSSSGKMWKHVTFSEDTKPATGTENTESDASKEVYDVVPRAELDLALYMMHQRDVRCEELTMELTHLLEERDTLQLRLSDSLRSYEDLKSKCKLRGLEVPVAVEVEPPLEKSFTEKDTQFVDTHRSPSSRSSSVSDQDAEKPKLQAKLSELRTVKHSRDVLFRHESEQRQLDMRLLQRDVANLPPEAIEQLQQAHHTLSRDSQSTSTVLLNWLRGKSTPKVVHDM